jgi:bleomycin hydrolase
MNDSWFDQYLAEIVTCQSALPTVLRAALEEPSLVVPAWDPMASWPVPLVRRGISGLS